MEDHDELHGNLVDGDGGFRLTVSCMKDDSLMYRTLSVGMNTKSERWRNLRNSGFDDDVGSRVGGHY
jgi:hypothetical protein